MFVSCPVVTVARHVNYVAFTRAIDPSEEYLSRDDQGRIGEVSSYRASGGFMASKVQPAQPGRTPLVAEFPRLVSNKPSQLDLNELLKRLQLKAKKFHISLEDFFVDHDRHRRGVITLAQFRAGMDRAFSQVRTASRHARRVHARSSLCLVKVHPSCTDTHACALKQTREP
eukprot:6173069-Pleurochrysis_carterae.AAC.2